MSINIIDGQYALEFYVSENTNNEPDDDEYSDNRIELENRAELIIQHGRFKHIFLVRWNANEDDWDTIREWKIDD